MEKVYIVTEGCYSDYHIEAVFESREKAEVYCECHDDCEIEEYDLNDDKIYTVFDAVYASGYIGEGLTNIKFYRHCYEDDPHHGSNFKKVSIQYDGRVVLRIDRVIPNDMSKMRAKALVEKIWNDYAAIIAYEISDLPKDYYRDFETRWTIEKDLNNLFDQSHVSSEDEL